MGYVGHVEDSFIEFSGLFKSARKLPCYVTNTLILVKRVVVNTEDVKDTKTDEGSNNPICSI